jgi:LPS-assembly protein
VDRQLGRSPFYWTYDAAVEGLSRSEPGFSTAPLLGRFDFSPALSLPLKFDGWSVRPELALRDTYYTQRLMPSPTQSGEAVSTPINRKALENSVEVRPPALDRVFNGEWLGRKWKHVIEPRAVYRYVTGVNNIDHILRFDERDILTNTNEVEYSMVNRLYAKRTAPKKVCGEPGMPLLFVGGAAPPTHVPWERQEQLKDGPCNTGQQVQEVVTWELSQKYFADPTFGGAFQPGSSNIFESTVELTGISFLTQPRHLSPLISRLRFDTGSRTDVEWDLDYDFRLGRINTSTAFVNYHVGLFTIGGGDAYLQVPAQTLGTIFLPQKFNQFRLLLGYGHTNKTGFSAAANVGFDQNLGFLQYAAAQTTYNWDCCGVNVEFRRFALGSVRNENQYRFTFALANLGSLGNLRRAERLF